jgi:hypothetical protein
MARNEKRPGFLDRFISLLELGITRPPGLPLDTSAASSVRPVTPRHIREADVKKKRFSEDQSLQF